MSFFFPSVPELTKSRTGDSSRECCRDSTENRVYREKKKEKNKENPKAKKEKNGEKGVGGKGVPFAFCV